MATDIERLVVSLEASTVRYERALQRAMGQTNQTARRIESRFERMNRGLGNSFVSLQRNIAVAFAGVAATRGATQLIDAATRIENSLKVAGLAGEELNRVYDSLFQSAQRNAAPIESLATLYGRLAIVQNELGASTEEMLSFTDNVAVALRVAGTDAQSASGALLQLSQAMGSGVVRAEEFNSILEGALPIAQAAAAGLEEAGGSVAKLRQLIVDGKVSSEAFFRAFEAGSVILQDKVANAELTVSQGFVRLQNVLIDTAREMNEGSRVSGALVDGLEGLGVMVQQIAALAEASVGPITDMANALNQAVNAVNEFLHRGAAINGLDRVGAAAATWINDLGIPGLTAGSSRAGGVLEGTFSLIGETPQDEALAAILMGETPPPMQITVQGGNDAPIPPVRPEGLGTPPSTGGRVNPISLEQYPIGGTAGGPSGSSGGRGGSSQADAYQRALEQQRERLRMLEMETALQQTLNPLVNDYGFAVERLRTQMELENAAAEAGLELTPERRAEIEQLAEGYATATANAQRLAEAQDKVREAAEAMGEAGRQALDTIVQGFIDGQSAGEIFGQVLSQLGSALLNMGLSSIGQSFGIPGFANGTMNAPGGMALVGEQGPELVNLPKGAQVIPNYRTKQMLGGSGAPAITFAPVIDARGADVAAVARLEQAMARQQAEFDVRVQRIVRSRGKKWID